MIFPPVRHERVAIVGGGRAEGELRRNCVILVPTQLGSRRIFTRGGVRKIFVGQQLEQKMPVSQGHPAILSMQKDDEEMHAFYQDAIRFVDSMKGHEILLVVLAVIAVGVFLLRGLGGGPKP